MRQLSLQKKTIFISAILSAATAVRGQAQFTILDLGTINGDSTFGWGVNAGGQVAGFSNENQGHEQAFRTSANSAINTSTDLLGTLGGTFSGAYGLNGNAQAVGIGGLPGNLYYHAVRT